MRYFFDLRVKATHHFMMCRLVARCKYEYAKLACYRSLDRAGQAQIYGIYLCTYARARCQRLQLWPGLIWFSFRNRKYPNAAVALYQEYSFVVRNSLWPI